jgi:acid phosphatase (class A)
MLPLNTALVAILLAALAPQPQPSAPAPAPATPTPQTPTAPAAPAPPEAPAPWVRPGDFDFAALLGTPNKPNTPLNTGEIELVLAMRLHAGPADYDRAQAEKDLTLDDFADLVGPALSKDRAARTWALAERVTKETDAVVQAAKQHFARPRPSDVDKRLPSQDKPSNNSYPSGHAARAWVMGRLLAELLPEHAEQVMDRARSVGWGRILLGVHYPSDIAAGFALGEAVYAKIRTNPEFADLAAAASRDFISERGR